MLAQSQYYRPIVLGIVWMPNTKIYTESSIANIGIVFVFQLLRTVLGKSIYLFLLVL